MTLSSSQPVDDVVSGLLSTIHRKGRGFVLDLASEGEKRVIEVKESLPVRDEFEGKAAYRNHIVLDGPSLTSWIQKYGSQEKSVVLIDDVAAVAILDDTVDRGKREQVLVQWRPSDDWKDWSNLVNKDALSHKQLHRFLLIHEHNLEDPGLLLALGSVKSTATVDHNSDIADSGRELGIVFKSTAGENLTKFPKSFKISLPVLDADSGIGTNSVATLRVEVVMPDEPMKPVALRIYCSTWKDIWRERVRKEESEIRKTLAGWLVLNGSQKYVDREFWE